MNDSNQSTCPDIINLGSCTRGQDCPNCNPQNKQTPDFSNINFNTNAKGYVPKSKREENNKLNFNLQAKEYVPKSEDMYYDNEEEMEEDDNEEEFDMIMKDIINNDAMDELEDDEESDEDKWFPNYKDCDCCKGFVYKCKGVACENMNSCYCKIKDECDEVEAN